ncbi:MAG TPA: phosphotransferase [Nevskiaceae bacterium]|nr:phosphotransferase [Nevskiaceae bacterium]
MQEIPHTRVQADLKNLGYGWSTYTEKSGDNSSVMVVDTGTTPEWVPDNEPYIAKIPRPGMRHKLWREGNVVALLADGDHPPLQIPHLYEWVQWPTYAVFRKVLGQVLERSAVRRFDPDEKVQVGTKMGETIAWMANTISIATYENEVGPGRLRPHPYFPSGRPVGEREQSLAYALTHKTELVRRGLNSLSGLLTDLYGQYLMYEDEGVLNPTIMGHDDLHPANLAFDQNTSGAWNLGGVFDFGLFKPTTPERELRHVYPFGDIALRAAATAYQARRPGDRIDMALVEFWAGLQASTTYAAFELKMRDTHYSRDIRLDCACVLSRLWPDIDWSELRELQYSQNEEPPHTIPITAEGL